MFVYPSSCDFNTPFTMICLGSFPAGAILFWDVLITSIQFLQKCHQQTREGLDFRFLRKALETTLLDKTLTMSTEALLVFLVPHFGWSTPFHSCTDS